MPTRGPVGGPDSLRYEPPLPAAGSVLRPRLVDTVRRRFDVRLTVVQAGAGFGKSTLLAQAVRENRLDPAGIDVWLALHGRDRDAATLRRGIGRALALARVRSRAAGDAAPETVGEPVHDPSVDELAEAVWALAPEPVAIVLDDTHLLDDPAVPDPAVGETRGEAWAVVRDLLERLPGNGHLVVSGRRAPALPVARLRSAAAADVLGEDDLAFTPDELEAFGRVRELPPALVAELPVWPALAALSGAVGHGASLDYLWDEVLAALDPTRRRVLAALAPFGEVDDDLVTAVGGDRPAAEVVAALPLVDATDAGTFHLHDLWREALARELDPAERAATLVAGARSLRARGELLRAAEAFALAGDGDGLDEVVRDFARRPTMATPTPHVERLHALLPADRRAGPAGAYLDAARVAATDDREAARRFAVAAERAEQAGDTELEALARWRVLQFDDLDRPDPPAVPPRLAALADAGVAPARAAVAFAASCRAQDDGDAAAALAALADLEHFHPLQRANSEAMRLFDLGRPELMHATLEGVLASGIGDVVEAQAVWQQGAIAPVDAWPLARGLAQRGDDELVATRVSLLSVLATMAVAAGEHRDALDLVERARRAAPATSTTVRLFPEVAAALVQLAVEGEAAAAATLGALLERVPLGRWPQRPYLYALAAIRVLAPGGDALDACTFGPSLTTAVEAGRALLAARAGDVEPAERLAWDAPALLRVHVPSPFLVELALAAERIPEARAIVPGTPHLQRWLRRVVDGGGRSADLATRLVRQLPPRPAHTFELALLGRVELVRSDGEPLDGWERRERVRQLLAHLALVRRAPRREVAAALWPDLPEDKAAANLRVNLTHLQQVLQPEREAGDAPWFVRADGEHLLVVRDGLVVDRDRLDEAVTEARAAEAAGLATRALAHYREADRLYRGDLLPGVDAEWVDLERLRLRSLAHAAAARAGELVLASGEPEEALALAVRALRLDPLSERAHRLFVRGHLALGSAQVAREAGARLRHELAAAGLTPEPETRRLLDRLDT